MPRPPQAPAPPRAVAIVRFSAAGDVLLTAQAIDALAAAWPGVPIIFVTHARLLPLVAGHPRLRAAVGYVRGDSLLALAGRLRRHYDVDAVLDLHGSLRSRLLAALVRPRLHARWHKRDVREAWAVQALGRPYAPARPMAARLHAAVEALVGRTLPLPPFVLTPPAGAALPAEATDGLAAGRNPWPEVVAAGARVAGAAPPRPVRVGFSPGAGWASKRWPATAWAALARALQARGVQVVLLGSAAERPLTRAVAAAAPGCVDWGGLLGWRQAYAAMASLDAVVAGDTGPMHLARGLGVPVVALFTSTPATQFFFGPRDVALQADVGCGPCSFYGRSSCPAGTWACLSALTPAQVLAATEQVLAGREEARACRHDAAPDPSADGLGEGVPRDPTPAAQAVEAGAPATAPGKGPPRAFGSASRPVQARRPDGPDARRRPRARRRSGGSA